MSTLTRKTHLVAAADLRPGDNILYDDATERTRYLVQTAPEYLPRLYGNEDTQLVRLQVHGADYVGPMLFVADDLVLAATLVGGIRLRVQALKPTDTRGQRFRVVITTPDGRRHQRTIPRDYSWDAIFPSRDAARVAAEAWYQTPVKVTSLYGNLTPGSTTFAATEA